jgi:hypothetical protein
MRVEDEYSDVLQNMEAVIANDYRNDPDLIDFNVMAALEALVDLYTAEKTKRPPKTLKLSEKEQSLYRGVKDICEWRMGRMSLDIEAEDSGESPETTAGESSVTSPELKSEEDGALSPEPKTVDEILKCLKRVQKSAVTWNRKGGRRGYLDFIVNYV